MPTYEYVADHKVIERRFKIGEAPDTIEVEGTTYTRRISPVALQRSHIASWYSPSDLPDPKAPVVG